MGSCVMPEMVLESALHLQFAKDEKAPGWLVIHLESNSGLSTPPTSQHRPCLPRDNTGLDPPP